MIHPTERHLQLALMLGSGAIAAAFSWSHVLTLAEDHGQHGAYSWGIAVCTETLAISCGLEARRRHRASQSVAVPLAVLAAAVAVQLTAQLAAAAPGLLAHGLAVLPAATFLVLVEFALASTGASSHPRTRTTPNEDASESASEDASESANPRTANPGASESANPGASANPAANLTVSEDASEPVPAEQAEPLQVVGGRRAGLAEAYALALEEGRLSADDSVNTVAAALGCSWGTANKIVKESAA